MSFAGYPFDEDVTEYEDKVPGQEWMDRGKALNKLAATVIRGPGPLVMKETHWYDNGYLFGCRETGGINLIPQDVYAYPVLVTRPGHITDLAAKVNTSFAATSASLGIWSSRSDGAPDQLLGSGTIVTTSTGWKQLAVAINVAVEVGLYWIGITCNSNSVAFETWQFENMAPLGRTAPGNDAIGMITMSGISGVTLANWDGTSPSNQWTGNAGTNLVRIMYQWDF